MANLEIMDNNMKWVKIKPISTELNMSDDLFVYTGHVEIHLWPEDETSQDGTDYC